MPQQPRGVGVASSCAVCGKEFSTHQKCAVHAHREHGHTRLIRRRIQSTTCPCCLQDFHTRERVLNHLAEKSERCRAMVLATQPELAPEVVQALDQTEAIRLRAARRAGWRRSHAAVPAVRVAGPLTAVAYGIGLSHQSLLRTGFSVWTDAMASNDVDDGG